MGETNLVHICIRFCFSELRELQLCMFHGFCFVLFSRFALVSLYSIQSFRFSELCEFDYLNYLCSCKESSEPQAWTNS